MSDDKTFSIGDRVTGRLGRGGFSGTIVEVHEGGTVTVCMDSTGRNRNFRTKGLSPAAPDFKWQSPTAAKAAAPAAEAAAAE